MGIYRQNILKMRNIRLKSIKKIAAIIEEEDYSELLDELIDRFGDIPKEVKKLNGHFLY